MKHEFQMGLACTCLNPCRIFKNKQMLPQHYQRPLVCSVFDSLPFSIYSQKTKRAKENQANSTFATLILSL